MANCDISNTIVWEIPQQTTKPILNDCKCYFTALVANSGISGLILGLRLANERRRCFVTRSLIGWAQALNQPCISNTIVMEIPQQTTIYASANLVKIGLVYGLSPVQQRAMIWTPTTDDLVLTHWGDARIKFIHVSE